ncbi:MAG: hypothetical protein U0M37_05950 [Blautia sp.]|nr:hypothetical protein [Clostridiales bacterium]
MILKSGNLLNMARLSFRVKCNDQFQGFRTLGCCPLLFEGGHFLWNAPVHTNYT